ncbi:MAG: hypothetical protein JOZ54_15365, partial [Acidobacteria bacterium]|nr:hypothetical protein [Acidobacteriota bacterium]
GGQFKFEKTDTASGELQIEKTETYELQDAGPSVDGIDHDRDLIYLLLKPKLDVTVDGNAIQWAFSGGGVPQHVSVGWLKNPSTLPKGVKDQLDSAGLTPADYAEILKLDPFANGNTNISSDRYLDTNIIIPYEPPFDQNDEGPTQTYTIDNQTSDTSTHSYEKSTDVGMTIGAEGGFGKVFEAKLEVSKTWTWTNGGATSTAAVRGETAKVKIGSPSFGYQGPTAVAIHFDRLYKTFLFSFVPVNSPLRATGTIKYLTQGPVKAHVVYLRAGGKTYRTVTNRRGEYRFFGTPVPGMEIEVQGLAKKKIESMQQPIANFTLPDKSAGQMKKN